jgi:uroporphyrinogen-III synthase
VSQHNIMNISHIYNQYYNYIIEKLPTIKHAAKPDTLNIHLKQTKRQTALIFLSTHSIITSSKTAKSKDSQ